MTLNQIRNIVAVAEIKSINATAKSLFISQSSLSNSIKELEEELGIVIFQRSNKGIILTKKGEEFIGYARNILYYSNLLQSHFSPENRDKFHFGVTMHHSTVLVRLFAYLVKEFGMQDYSYSVFETNTQNVIEDVQNRKSELGLLYMTKYNEMAYEKRFWEAGLDFHIVAECPVCVYIAGNHPLADREEVGLEELEEYPCLLFEQGNSSMFYYEEIFSDYEYKNVIKTRDRATAIDLILKKLGIPYENAYAIGDSMNDLPMLQAVPNSIAMGGAEKIYPYVSYITTPIEEDGIANALRHFGLI